MSVELNAATLDFLGDGFTFLDCPGSIEFQADAADAKGLGAQRLAALPEIPTSIEEGVPGMIGLLALGLLLILDNLGEIRRRTFG